MRADERRGYVFISNYERGLKTKDEILDIDIGIDDIRVKIDNVKIAKDSIYFFPIKNEIGGILFDYITAQPIVKVKGGNDITAYFMKPDGADVRICVDGKVTLCEEKEYSIEGQKNRVILKFLNEREALKLHYINGEIFSSDSDIYELDGNLVCELYEGDSLIKNNEIIAENNFAIKSNFVTINEIDRVKLKYDYFMYSKGKRKFYELNIDNGIFDGCDDIQVTLDFIGLNLQIFHNGQIVDDYFNTDGKYVFRLARYKNLLKSQNKFIIRACAKTERGEGSPYNEMNIPSGEVELKVDSVKSIKFVVDKNT